VTTIDHFLLLKKHLTYMWFLFLVIYTTTFFDDQSQENEKKNMWKNTRISVFGAHDLGKKDTEKKNPILRSARETQALLRLKNIHHPPSHSFCSYKKEQLIIFCVMKDKKILYENHSPWFSLTSLWICQDFAQEKWKKKCFVLFCDSSLLLPLGKTNHFKEKKIDAIVGLKRKLLFIWSENWKLKIKKKIWKKWWSQDWKLAIKNKYPHEINIRCHFTIRWVVATLIVNLE